MKKILTLLLGIAFLTVLYLGQQHWNEQRQAAAKGDKAVVNGTNADAGSEKTAATAQSEEPAKSVDAEKLLALTENWPKDAVERFKVTLEEKKPFKVLFVGSPAIGSESDGPFADVKARLVGAFGEEHMEVSVYTYESTTTQFLKDAKEDEIAKEAADLIVFEPFILTNNEFGTTDKTLTDVTKILDAVKKAVPDTSFLIQPSYPLYKAKHYPRQVADLKEYAEEQQVAYLDHWTSWPDGNSEEIKAYLTSDLSAPNSKGNKLWSDYLAGFLISEGESESE
ncbi:SGNH/GDSL hydrolase family protein [Neobacillus kokaensis]|uniref:SGNH/GDSL hydrolase family protein n=1 Tax=Neobacillus kokaensis TaxID=2759023 RepID=A0ABQ3N3H4_9BACI|nr:SGNH/GDSL hydrolase family protein [Neobacillus kokaensis]GHH98674.1 hypothetical protein AM1BK_22170 [Neobacillus kokaensis]